MQPFVLQYGRLAEAERRRRRRVATLRPATDKVVVRGVILFLLVARLAGARSARRGFATLLARDGSNHESRSDISGFQIRSDGGSVLGSTGGSPLRTKGIMTEKR